MLKKKYFELKEAEDTPRLSAGLFYINIDFFKGGCVIKGELLSP